MVARLQVELQKFLLPGIYDVVSFYIVSGFFCVIDRIRQKWWHVISKAWLQNTVYAFLSLLDYSL